MDDGLATCFDYLRRSNRKSTFQPMLDWCWIERFQTLIAGVLAIGAALITAMVIFLTARAPLKAGIEKYLKNWGFQGYLYRD